MATSSAGRTRDGNKQERTEWHRVKFFGKLGEIAGEYLKKGRQVYVEGRCAPTNTPTRTASRSTRTDIIADEMQMLGGNRGGKVAVVAPSARAPQRAGGGGGGYGGGHAQRPALSVRQPASNSPPLDGRFLGRRYPVLRIRVCREGVGREMMAPALTANRRARSTGPSEPDKMPNSGRERHAGRGRIDEDVARHRRRRLHRRQLRARRPGAAAARIVNLDTLTYAGNLDARLANASDPGYMFVHGDICDSALVGGLLDEHRLDAIVQLRRREPRRPLDRRPGRVRPDQRHGHADPAGGGARYWRGSPAGTNSEASASCTSPPTRSTARSGRRALHRDTPYAELAVLGLQGLLRPPGARLRPHLRPAGADHQLLEQLRAYQFPEKLIPLVILSAEASRCRSTATAGTCATGSTSSDHCAAIRRVLKRGRVGETYNVGGDASDRTSRW